MGSESRDAAMFWTFAPYVYKILKQKGLDETQALNKVLKWGQTANVGAVQDDSPRRVINLKGLNYLNEALSGHSYYLTKNPMGATHQFTAQEAEKLVNEVLLK